MSSDGECKEDKVSRRRRGMMLMEVGGGGVCLGLEVLFYPGWSIKPHSAKVTFQ